MASTLGKDAVRRRQAARREDIETFVALAKLPLPPLYLGYLREFGADDGALKMADDADLRVTALIELYEESAESEPDVPLHIVVIGAYGLSERLAFDAYR